MLDGNSFANVGQSPFNSGMAAKLTREQRDAVRQEGGPVAVEDDERIEGLLRQRF